MIFFGLLMLAAVACIIIGIDLAATASTITEAHMGWAMILCGLTMSVIFGFIHYSALIRLVTG